MKRLKIALATITLALFLSPVALSFAGKDPKTATTNNPVGITYIVEIHLDESYGLCQSYYVTITDEQGNTVAPPKFYLEGVTSYVFHEEGNLYYETRVAHLEEIESSGPNICSFPVYAPPAQQLNNFISGYTYVFDLYPVAIPGDD